MEQIENTQKQNTIANANAGVSTNAWLTGIAAVLFMSIVFWAETVTALHLTFCGLVSVILPCRHFKP
jgi:hypothetical protein